MQTTREGMRAFRSGLAKCIACGAAVPVLRHGQTVGCLIPVQGQVDADTAALKRAGAKLDEMLATAGIDTESLVAEFDIARKQSRTGRKRVTAAASKGTRPSNAGSR